MRHRKRKKTQQYFRAMCQKITNLSTQNPRIPQQMRPLSVLTDRTVFRANTRKENDSKGILGKTPEEHDHRYNTRDNEYVHPRHPAYKAITYNLPGTQSFFTIGYDMDKKARYVESGGKSSSPSFVKHFLDKQGYSWKTEKSLSSIFPSLWSEGKITQKVDRWVPIARRNEGMWTKTLEKNVGQAIEVPHILEFSRVVYVSRNGDAYAYYDFCKDSLLFPNGETSSVTVADSDTFWLWITDELFHQLGYMTQEYQSNVEYQLRKEFHEMTYEKAYSQVITLIYQNLGNHRPTTFNAFKDERILERLNTALNEMVENPYVSDELVKKTAVKLWPQNSKVVIDIMIKALQSQNAATGFRAAVILKDIQDFNAVGPLIELLRHHKSGYNSANKQNTVIALKGITGEDFGEDYKKWRDWLRDKRLAEKEKHSDESQLTEKLQDKAQPAEKSQGESQPTVEQKLQD